jgi:hypothetical protein
MRLAAAERTQQIIRRIEAGDMDAFWNSPLGRLMRRRLRDQILCNACLLLLIGLGSAIHSGDWLWAAPGVILAVASFRDAVKLDVER